MSYQWIRPLLFSLDPEAAHELVTTGMRRAQGIPGVIEIIHALWGDDVLAETTVWGLHFANPVGVAAGFDKNGELVPFLRALGFGFVEVGTVTLDPQPGNPRPRLFRVAQGRALINRLGFNNEGAERVAGRLRSLRHASEAAAEPWAPLFVNIGKNRSVSLDDAVDSYVRCYRRLAPWADGVVVNVSSPNTPGLRDLQNPSILTDLLHALRAERDATPFGRPGVHPILVKIAPDLTIRQLEEITGVCTRLAEGMVATNTTLDHRSIDPARDEAGGLSGEPLFQASTEMLRMLRLMVGPDYPLVGVGGIMTGRDALGKLDAGANLVQIYTGLVYGGPGLARELIGTLAGRGA